MVLASDNGEMGLKKFPNLGYYILLGLMTIVCFMTGSTGMLLGPVFLGICALVTAIGNKKPAILGYTLLYMIPGMIMIIRTGMIMLSSKGIVF